MNPTAAQLAASESAARYTVIRSGPGSGKTSVIVWRIAHLLNRGVAPHNIRALTFTRSAAEAIRSRLTALMGASSGAVDVTTFHALAMRIVDEHTTALRGPPPRRVATEEEQNQVFSTLFNGPAQLLHPPLQRALRAGLVEFAATGSMPLELGPDIRRLIQRFYDRSLVPMWFLIPAATSVEIGRHDPIRRAAVLVDESQDCTLTEATLARNTATFNATWTIVGDERQAIMGWRGASPVAFAPEANDRALELTLSESFRFGPAITRVANCVAAAFGGAPIRGSNIDDAVRFLPSFHFDDISEPSRTAILVRSNPFASWLGEASGGRAVHVRRDPLDPFAHEADRFDEVSASGRVVISTIHSAKGREWDNVIIPRDEWFPRDAEPEELRVLYVAVTRARRNLTVCELSPAGERVLGGCR